MAITNNLASPVFESQLAMTYAGAWSDYIPHLRVLIKSNNGGIAATFPLRLQQGAIFLMRVPLERLDGAKHDLDNWLVRGAIREAVDSSAVVGGVTVQSKDYTFIEGTGRVRSGGSAGGYFDLLLLADETAAMTFDAGVWDLELVKVDLTAITQGGSYTSAALVKGTTQGTLTANGGTPFSGVSAGDIIRLSSCENALNDGVYIVASRTDTVLTFTKPLGFGFGSDNAADTAVVLQIMDPNESYVIKLVQGSARLDKAVTR